MRPRLPALSALAAVCLFSVAQAQVQRKDFEMRYYAPFLEPGLGDGAARRGDELVAGSVEWLGPAKGRLPASMWFKKATIEFETSADRRTITALSVDLGKRDQPGQSGWDVWRHRHTYLKHPNGYFWNTLGDDPVPMESAVGARCDEALFGAWQLWARRTVQRVLGGLIAASPSESENDNATLHKKMRMGYDRKGLVGTASGEFTIRAWHVPARVRFTIKAAQPSHLNQWIIGLAGPIELQYDREEWRRRHGYSRGLFSGYAWDADFPDPKPDIAAAGPKLDELMDRGIAFWAEVSVSLVMDNLDRDLKQAMGQLPGPRSSVKIPRPAYDRLADIQARSAWP